MDGLGLLAGLADLAGLGLLLFSLLKLLLLVFVLVLVLDFDLDGPGAASFSPELSDLASDLLGDLAGGLGDGGGLLGDRASLLLERRFRLLFSTAREADLDGLAIYMKPRRRSSTHSPSLLWPAESVCPPWADGSW